MECSCRVFPYSEDLLRAEALQDLSGEVLCVGHALVTCTPQFWGLLDISSHFIHRCHRIQISSRKKNTHKKEVSLFIRLIPNSICQLDKNICPTHFWNSGESELTGSSGYYLLLPYSGKKISQQIVNANISFSSKVYE